MSNFNLSSQERGIKDSHKLLRKIWVTELFAVFHAQCGSPIDRSKI